MVIATQFSETKKREMERMKIERALGRSSSTLTSTNASEPSGCYNQLFKYIAHIGRKTKRKMLRYCRRFKRKKSISKEEGTPCSISLKTRRTDRPPWSIGQSSLKNGSQSPGSMATTTRESTVVRDEGSANKPVIVVAPCASPEISDVEFGSSPRDAISEPTDNGGNRKLKIPGELFS